MNQLWLSHRKHVYREFLTQLAVAWFAGGVIAPIVAPNTTSGGNLLPSLVSIGASFISLRLAVVFSKGGI